PPQLEVTNCDLKCSASLSVSWNMKSWGNLSALRLTACTKARVSTPYSAARSASNITVWPRMTYIWAATRSTGMRRFALAICALCQRASGMSTTLFGEKWVNLPPCHITLLHARRDCQGLQRHRPRTHGEQQYDMLKIYPLRPPVTARGPTDATAADPSRADAWWQRHCRA